MDKLHFPAREIAPYGEYRTAGRYSKGRRTSEWLSWISK